MASSHKKKQSNLEELYKKQPLHSHSNDRLTFCSIILIYSIFDLANKYYESLKDPALSKDQKIICVVVGAVWAAIFNGLVFWYFTCRKNKQFLRTQVLETILVVVLGGGNLIGYSVTIKVIYFTEIDMAKRVWIFLRLVIANTDAMLSLVLILSFVQRIYNLMIYVVLVLSGLGVMLFFAEMYGIAIKTVAVTVLAIFAVYYLEKKRFISFSETWRLKESDVFYKSVLNFLPESILVLNSEGKVAYSNDYFAKMFKCELKNDLKGFASHFSTLKFRDCIQETNSSIEIKVSKKSLIASNDDSFRLEAQNIEGLTSIFGFFQENLGIWSDMNTHTLIFDGKYIHPQTKEISSVEIKAFIIIGGGEPQLTLIFRDTTERDIIATLESENQTYKNNVIASFSHELRTPLNSNLGSLEQSMNHPDIPQKVKDTLIEPALVSAKLLLYLINDTLDYSQILNRSFQLHVKPGLISETIMNCVSLFQKRVEAKELKFEVNIGQEEEKLFYTDHQRLSQVLINLLSNALKFTLQGKIQLDFSKGPNGYYVLSVTDTGIGMDEQVQETLRKNLGERKALKSKVSSDSAGVGLGLVMASTFCHFLSPEGCQGGLQFSSVKDKGTEFYFGLKEFPKHASKKSLYQLPKARKNDERSPALRSPLLERNDSEHEIINIETPVTSYPTHAFKNKLRKPNEEEKETESLKSRVMIVDDEIFNLMILENYCTGAGLNSERAFNGKEALNKIKKLGKVEMVFMDVNMPVMDGYETTIELRKQVEAGELDNLVIIGVTAYVSKEKIDKCYECGMDEVVNKPLSQGDFLNLMKKYNMI